MRLLILLPVAAVVFHTLLFAQQVVTERSCGAATELGVVLAVEKSSPSELKAVSINILKHHFDDRLLYAIFGNTALAVRSGLRRTHVGSDDETEIVGKAILNSESAARGGAGPLAALIRIGGDAVLVSSAGGKSSRLLIEGAHDPTSLHFNNTEYSVVHVDLANPASRLPMPRPCILTMYVKADNEPSVNDSSALQRRFQELVPRARVATLVRRDGWFFDDEGYPDIPILLGFLIFPEADRWLLARRISCSSPGWPSNLVPQCAALDPQGPQR